MPLIMAETGKCYTVKEIRGGKEAKHRLEKLGFVEGAAIEIISRQGGNTIVKVFECRVAIGAGMATKIIV
ncbi:MAG: ferrous iron transport protein A [Christensenellaceae bacterium]|nr:ferrous iron transport protein A [Christensenellaceae bacterium]